MKKRVLITILICFLSVLSVAVPSASAHFLATDGNIGAVLHVDPNDEPVAGSQASFFFAFKDKQNKFQPENCNCTFEIDENGKSIFTQPLFQNNTSPSLSNASVFYTFPQRDVYTVRVIGKPLTPNDFQPFTLSWNFRVDQVGQTNNANSSDFITKYLVLIILGIVGLVIGMLLVIRQIVQRKGVTK